MTSTVWHNGRLVPEHELAVSPFNRAMLYGDGVFATMRSRCRRIFRCDEHIGRLLDGLRALSIRPTFEPAAIHAGVASVVRHCQTPDLIVKIMAYRDGPDGPDPDPDAGSSIIIFAKPFNAIRQARCERGVRGHVVSLRRNNHGGLAALKSLSYHENIVARIEARMRGADEAIFLNIDGKVAEGATSNIFCIEGERLWTPPPAAGILNGITRRAVLQCAGAGGIVCREEAFGLSRLAGAGEAFLTNAVMGIIPLVQVGRVVLGGGVPGPVTAKMQRLYKALVAREAADE
jgi:branched-chain amino acid aminotransferase